MRCAAIVVAALGTFAFCAAAASTHAKGHPNTYGQACHSQYYDVAIQTNRTLFDLGYLDQRNQSRTTDLLVDGAVHKDRIAPAVRGQEPYATTVRIYGTLCTPRTAASSAPLHVLVHGLGFDSSYWDIQAAGMAADTYSYVAAAAKRGISTFRFDRLGTGKSQRPADGINEVQGAIEAAILGQLLGAAKSSNLIGGRPWQRVVVVGHSYGSILAHAVSREAPALIDGLVLTGFSANDTATPYYLLAAGYVVANRVATAPALKRASSNWLITGSEQGRQVAFLYSPTVTSAGRTLLATLEQPVSLGTLFTIPYLFGRAEAYKGPVQIVLADNDFIFALQEGSEAKAKGAAAGLYPNSVNATSYVPSSTGHAINLHTTAPTIYSTIFALLQDNKLL